MQSFTDIPSTNTLTSSRQPLLNNDLTSISCNSGTAFPTAYSLVGMLCFRTDTKKLYQLKDTPATISSNWHLIADLNESYVYKDYVDTNFAQKNGDYSGLRARSTTKADVGLEKIPNSISSSLSINNNSTLATSKAAYDLNVKIGDNAARISSVETNLTTKAATNGSKLEDFSASRLYAQTDIFCNGDITAFAGISIPSDRRLKKDIQVIDDALERLAPLSGVTYTLISNDRECLGLIAQEVEETIPEVVRSRNGHLALDYPSLGGVFVSAINELHERIKKLEAMNAAL